MDDWQMLLALIKNNPFDWMLTFEGGNEITLEYFGDSYIGDLESGCGDWQVSGTLPEVIAKTRARLTSG